jgi:hypothetical protein
VSLSAALSGSVGTLLQRARLLEVVNLTLTQWCDDPWIQQIRLVNLRDGTVVVYADNAAALSMLRHRSRSFLSWLNARHALGAIHLHCQVRPPIGD